MSPHRRRCLTKAILEIKGTLSGITAEVLLKMSSAQLLALHVEIEKALETANATEPAPPPRED
jgi:hypothetical protein